jgi:diguanylate cyclase (GGDEF)-like protein
VGTFENENRIEELEARVGELAAENERLRDAITLFGEALAAAHDVDQLLQVVLDVVIEAPGAEGGSVTLLSGLTAESGQTDGADRIEVPLRAGSKSYGELVLAGPGFAAEDTITAVSLAAHAVIALDNARLHRIVERQALLDGLTGLANRRQSQRSLESEVARAERFGTPLTAVLVDLDDFKQVNDHYGHLVGDDVLREIATVLADTVRTADVAGRWGGEEFLLLLPGTDSRGGQLLAERARKTLAERTILTPEGDSVRVTASFGVASLADNPDGTALVAAADRALYQAKRLGKNRVETANSDSTLRAVP